METTRKDRIAVFFRKKVMTIFFSVIFAVSSTLAITALAATFYDVDIIETDADGAQAVYNVATRDTEVEEIVTRAGLEIGRYDVVDTSDFRTGEDSSINLYRSCRIRVDLGERVLEIPTAAATVAYTLEQNDIELGENDALNCDADDVVYEGMEVEVYRAFTVPIDDNGTRTQIEIATGTVRDALQAANIKLGKDDTVKPSLDTELYDGIAVKVLRTEYVVTTETETIPFEKKTVKDNKMENGTRKITQEGKDGEALITKTEKYVNGKLVDTTETTKTVVKPIDQITTVGTHVESITLKNGAKTVSALPMPSSIVIDDNAVPVNYKSSMDGIATAYCCGTHTATGKGVRTGYVAVNPKVIPYGTKMWIVSLDGKYVYGYAVAEDTGGFARNGSGIDVDLYFDTVEECYEFGRRGVRIYFL